MVALFLFTSLPMFGVRLPQFLGTHVLYPIAPVYFYLACLMALPTWFAWLLVSEAWDSTNFCKEMTRLREQAGFSRFAPLLPAPVGWSRAPVMAATISVSILTLALGAFIAWGVCGYFQQVLGPAPASSKATFQRCGIGLLSEMVLSFGPYLFFSSRLDQRHKRTTVTPADSIIE